MKTGDKVKITLKGGREIIGTIEKEQPLKIRTDQSSVQVIPNGIIEKIEKQ